jgi:nitrile hydratase subunit alpha
MPPGERLAKLTALEQWLDWQLNSTRQKIRTVQAQIERDRRQAARAYAEQRWKFQPARNGDRHAILHRGGCTLYKNEHGYVERREVLLALEDDTLTVEMCQICKPETGLRG